MVCQIHFFVTDRPILELDSLIERVVVGNFDVDIVASRGVVEDLASDLGWKLEERGLERILFCPGEC